MGNRFNFTNYHSFESHVSFLTCLDYNYAGRVATIEIGKSVEGRAIKVIQIGRPRADGTTKPAVWIDGGIHAREWISPSSVEYVVHELVENYASPRNKILVDNLDIYVLPILNPDGYVILCLAAGISSF